jgi:hypothetical protein
MIEGRGIATFVAAGGLLIALAASAACSYKVARYCDDDTPCQDPELPFCDRTGEFSGIGNQCIANPFDGGVDINAILSALEVSRGELDPPFDPLITSYTLNLGLGAEDLTITPTAAETETSILVNESAVESGSPSAPVLLDLGPNSIEIEVLTASGSTTYTIDVSRGAGILQEAYIKASNTDPVDGFGSRIAISDDTLVVSSLGEDSDATGINGDQTDNTEAKSGAVYVFVRTGATWSQQAYIKASNSEGGVVGDQFGGSLTLSGDTLAVGARFEDSSATGINGVQGDNTAGNAGAVYIFVRTGTTWAQQAYIKASNTDPGDVFGSSVALDQDTLAVGASAENSSATGVDGDQSNNSATSSGAVYVFTRTATNWSQQAYIKASNTDDGDRFGTSLSLSADTLAVGASGEDSSDGRINGNESNDEAENAGAVYVFTRSGTDWTQQAYIKASNADAGDGFGGAVVISGDTLAVGASGEDSRATGVDGDETDDSAEDAGAVYVFARSGASWSPQAYLKASNPDTVDRFGAQLALSGNVLAVGATFEDSGSSNVNGDQADNGSADAGAAYLFTRQNTVWSQQAYLKTSNADADDHFGAVAISGNTVAVGASGESSSATGIGGSQNDNNADGAGAVYIFE